MYANREERAFMNLHSGKSGCLLDMIRINTDKVGRKRKIHGDAGGKNGRYNIHEQGIILAEV